jgi:hypothetical protein
MFIYICFIQKELIIKLSFCQLFGIDIKNFDNLYGTIFTFFL